MSSNDIDIPNTIKQTNNLTNINNNTNNTINNTINTNKKTNKKTFETIDIIFISIICLILILYLFQYHSLKKVNNEKVILQKDNPGKEDIEEILKNKLPTIFTGMIERWEVKDDIKIKKEEFDKNTKIFDIPLCVGKKYNRIELEENNYSNVFRETSTRNIIFLLEGVLKFYIFTPSQQENIEFKNNISKYNIWKEPKKFKDVNYTEIVFSEGQIIYIPRGWCYCYYVEEDCDIVMSKTESIFSIILSRFIK